MSHDKGFPSSLRWVPVPAQLLGPLLEEIADEAELRCTLRYFWHLAQVKGHPRKVSTDTLLKDDVLLASLGSETEVRRGLTLALRRGTLLCVVDGDGAWLLVHTPENAQAAEGMGRVVSAEDVPAAGAVVDKARPEPQTDRPNIFSLYEANIGLLTPIVADQLKQAEEEYPQEWIEAAFREAAEHNKRNWRYIARILERWAVEGRHGAEERGPWGSSRRPTERDPQYDKRGTRRYGEPGRHSETLSAAEILRRRNLSR